jgi:hypothetical protein
MNTHRTRRVIFKSWIAMAAPWAGATLTAGAITALWFFQAADSPSGFLLLAALLAATTGIGVLWQQARARTRKWEAILDAYAEWEMSHHRRRKARSPERTFSRASQDSAPLPRAR